MYDGLWVIVVGRRADTVGQLSVDSRHPILCAHVSDLSKSYHLTRDAVHYSHSADCGSLHPAMTIRPLPQDQATLSPVPPLLYRSSRSRWRRWNRRARVQSGSGRDLREA